MQGHTSEGGGRGVDIRRRSHYADYSESNFANGEGWIGVDTEQTEGVENDVKHLWPLRTHKAANMRSGQTEDRCLEMGEIRSGNESAAQMDRLMQPALPPSLPPDK